LAILGIVPATASCRGGERTLVTYFSNTHGLSLKHPAEWKSEQQQQDGVWYRYFVAPGKDGRPSNLSATLFVAPFTEDLDGYAQTYTAGQPAAASNEVRPGLKGRAYAFDSKDRATRHLLLVLLPDAAGATAVQAPAVFGLHVQGEPGAFQGERKAIDAMAASLSLERAALYPEKRNAAYGFALRVPPSWESERTLSGGDTFLGQYRSPALSADSKGRTSHASLTMAVQKAPGDGSLDSYYRSIRDGMGDAFPVLSHEPWNGGYADLMRTETQVADSRIKRYYRVAGGRGYSLTCEAQEDVFTRMDRWCDIIASSLRVGPEAAGS
jgi:hypothetical protein